MPNVPNVPGVPTLSSYSASNVVLVAADAATVLQTFLTLGQAWGLYLNGSVVLPTSGSFFGLPIPNLLAPLGNTNVVSADFKKEWLIADYPLEGSGAPGVFESYDKVQMPFEIRMRFSAGGSAANRTQLLNAVDAAATSLNLYSAVTPEATYDNVSIAHYDYHRESHGGLGILIVDVWLQQIRVTTAPAFSNTASPSGASQQSGGTVQPGSASGNNPPVATPADGAVQ